MYHLAVSQYRHRAIVHTTAPYEDAGRGVGLAIAGVAAASAGALIAIGLIGYSAVVVVRATMWPLWYPVGRLVGLTGLDGLNARNWDRVFDALGALASSRLAWCVSFFFSSICSVRSGSCQTGS